jgi:hypothetical protein
MRNRTEVNTSRPYTMFPLTEEKQHYEVVGDLIQSYWGENPDITFLEIGVFKGVMEKYLADRFSNLKIIGVDMITNPFNEAELKRITYMNMNSEEASRLIPKNSLDFVYIDGDHTLGGCSADIKNYLPLLKNKAILAGHDYCLDWGVREAVLNMFGEVRLGDNLTWWIAKADVDVIIYEPSGVNIHERYGA